MSSGITKTNTDQDAKYIQGHSQAALASHGSRTAHNSAAYLLPHLYKLAEQKPDLKILDVGCGPGSITVSLATLFPQAHFTGTEVASGVSEGFDAARQLAARHGVTNVSFVEADVHKLVDTFGPGSFDVVHSSQVMQHCGRQVHAFQQMKGVVRPGGIVAARAADIECMAWFPESDPAMLEWRDLSRKIWAHTGATLSAGRQISSWARQAGFDMERAALTAGTQCWASRSDTREFAENHARRITEDRELKQLAIEKGLATEEELERLGAAIRAWGDEQDAWLAILNGEIVAYV